MTHAVRVSIFVVCPKPDATPQLLVDDNVATNENKSESVDNLIIECAILLPRYWDIIVPSIM